MNTPLPQPQIGRVITTHGRHCVVETPAGEHVPCHLRGQARDVVTGDAVQWQQVSRSHEGAVVEKRLERRSLLFRQDATRTKAIAANVDQVLILLAAEPAPSERFLARALIACEAAGVRPLIALNKADLQPAFADAQTLLQPYAALGYAMLPPLALAPAHSAPRTESELAPIQAALQSAVTLVIGPSGVGKSTLINRLAPDAAARTGALSPALKTGTQTTTATRWYWLDAERHTALIDSPGFLEFGLHHIAPTALAGYFPEFRPHLGQCRFANCSHTHEPGCAVRAAIDAIANAISPARYELYCALLRELRA